jgi:hypothetical protein
LGPSGLDLRRHAGDTPRYFDSNTLAFRCFRANSEGKSMSLVSAKQLKAETNLSIPTIRAACLRAGVAVIDGLFDHDSAIAATQTRVDPSRVAGHAANGHGDQPHSSAITTLADSRAYGERMRARKIEIEVLQAEGRLVERAEVIATGRDLIVKVKSALLNLGTRAAPQVVGNDDIADIARKINDHVRAVLGELSGEDVWNDSVLR